MQVKPHLTAVIILVGLGAKDPAAVSVQHVLLNELIDGPPGLKRWVQLQQRLRPQEAPRHLVGDRVGDPHEAFGVVGVIADDVAMEIKGIHGFPQRTSSEAVTPPIDTGFSLAIQASATCDRCFPDGAVACGAASGVRLTDPVPRLQEVRGVVLPWLQPERHPPHLFATMCEGSDLVRRQDE